MWLFKLFKHRHKWIKEKRVNFNLNGLVTFHLRRCKCGTVEIQHNGETGDGGWHPFDGSFKTEWEQEWFEQATLIKQGEARKA